ESMSMRMPPLFLFSRQPPAVSVSPSAVTHRGRPSSASPSPLRWQRSSVVRCQTRKSRVDEPQLVVRDIRHFVDLHVAGYVRGTRQKARIVLTFGLEL